MGILEKLHEMKNVNENPRLGRWETLDNIMEVLPGKGEQELAEASLHTFEDQGPSVATRVLSVTLGVLLRKTKEHSLRSQADLRATQVSFFTACAIWLQQLQDLSGPQQFQL
ncbi:hypothetical protein U0070_014998 [Myodes glareolus]|uniref:Uncharacterized protein n=1 Tax=Myodes glareolus TaxID=447135 RepID=A0AAW0I4S3_MYOGA